METAVPEPRVASLEAPYCGLVVVEDPLPILRQERVVTAQARALEAAWPMMLAQMELPEQPIPEAAAVEVGLVEESRAEPAGPES